MNCWLWFIVIFIFCIFYSFLLVVGVLLPVIDCLERLLSEITCYVSSGTLNIFALTYSEFLRYPPDAIINRVQRYIITVIHVTVVQ